MIKVVVLLVAVFALSSASHDDENKERRLTKRAALKSAWIWPGGVLFYKFSTNLDNAGRNRIRRAMAHIEGKTCIRFRERRNEPNYVLMRYDFQKGACNSRVGYIGGEQVLNIANPKVLRDTGYCDDGSVIHEIGHALGFFHEQSRPDRDRYVKINLKNLAPEYKWAASNFDKTDRQWVDDRGVGYDFGSLMHYPRGAFAGRGKQTITPLQRNVHIGQRNGLSAGDVTQLKKMYNCRI